MWGKGGFHWYFVRTALPPLTLFILLMVTAKALADNTCFPVTGNFVLQVAPQAECPSHVNYCMQGRLTGKLRGVYDYLSDRVINPEAATALTVTFYTGFSQIRTLHGELYLTDTGALDTATGSFSALLTITEGTEYFSNATGYLHMYGTKNIDSHFSSGRYNGKICRE